MSWIGVQILMFFGLVVLSALFASAEVSYTGLTAQELKRMRQINPDALKLWEKSPDRVLAMLLLSNSGIQTAVGVLSVSLGVSIAQALHVRGGFTTVVVSFLSGISIFFFGELIPKVWAKEYTLPWALTVTPFMSALVRIQTPIVNTIIHLTHAILLGYPEKTNSPFIGEKDLRKILDHATIPSGSKKLLDNVMDFSRSRVSDVMVSRSHVFALPVNEKMEKIIEKVIRSGFSRIPMYSNSIDNVVGVLYAKDLLIAWRSGAVVMDDLLRPVYRVEADMPLADLLRAFRTGRHHLALVVKKGSMNRVEGLITLQDAIERIVGDIKPEK
jgi:CBS domain containing-hemolysin-like protein